MLRYGSNRPQIRYFLEWGQSLPVKHVFSPKLFYRTVLLKSSPILHLFIVTRASTGDLMMLINRDFIVIRNSLPMASLNLQRLIYLPHFDTCLSDLVNCAVFLLTVRVCHSHYYGAPVLYVSKLTYRTIQKSKSTVVTR